jgi:hypothetical protein
LSKSVQPRDINELYYGHDESCNCGDDDCKDAMHCVSTVELADEPLFNTGKLIKDALLNIYSNTNIQNGVEPNLWKVSFDQLNDAVDQSFGKIKYNHPDYGFIQELKHNNGVFAAFKAYDQAEELRANLLDENGKIKSFSQFNKDTAHIQAKHKRHRRTEYNTAVKRARSAQQFREFQKTAHLYPNIRWTPSRSANPDKIHMGYYGTTLPINDPFWQSNFPGSRWGCLCGWEVTDATPTSKPDNIETPVPGLDKNPVNTNSIFTQTHPVYKVSKTKKKAITRVAESLIKRSSAYIPRVIKGYANGGKILQTIQVDKTAGDYKRVFDIADAWAKQGDLVEITPNLRTVNHPLYKIIYGALKNTKYWTKHPDLKRNGLFYEHEGFKGKDPKRALKNMLNRGLKQSSRIVIEDSGVTDNYLRTNIEWRIKQGQIIDEVWILRNNKLIEFYKNE